MIVTDAMIDKAADAYGMSSEDMFHRSNMYAALAAVAPMIIRQILEEVADEIYNRDADIAEALLARAKLENPR